MGYLCNWKIKIRVSDPHFFFADPDPDLDPGKNLHADPDPDPGGIRGRGLGVKGKKYFFLVFFTFQMILNNRCLKSEQKKWNCLHCTSPTLQNNDLFIHFLTFLPGSGSRSGSGQGKNMRILRIRIRIRIRNPELNTVFPPRILLISWASSSRMRSCSTQRDWQIYLQPEVRPY